MQRAIGFPALCLLVNLHAAGCFSGDSDHLLAIHQRKIGKPVFIYHHAQTIEKSLDTSHEKTYKHSFHSPSHMQTSKRHPGIIVKSTFTRPAYDPSLNLLAMTGQDLEVENLPIPEANVIIVVNIKRDSGVVDKKLASEARRFKFESYLYYNQSV
ncbi:receptor-type tyrosine-protein phosphatase R-like [Trichosurus vulpecula]|uniref:receptor-type tyrosine-protein phosphatase R-like n=1 Tax=Trichosurus vulpecula TaxID=9337 RepID=UPI00186AE6E1|nr:receptor-type tyrosine-protein phosphatase R-like [Trichosurus vulpecula]